MSLELLPDLAASLEASALGRAAKFSTWLYPTANILHFIGLAFLVGGIASFDIALLRGHQLTSRAGLGRMIVRLAAAGLLITMASGLVLLAADASRILAQPIFFVKMALIALALGNAVAFRRVERKAALAQASAAGSIMLWLAVVVAGGLIPYL